MDISVIIVNYKNYELTEQCVNSVIKTVKSKLNYEIIIIDNNSQNESFNYLKNKFKEYDFVEVIENNMNVGFGAANNLAASKATSKYLLFLNPDVVALDDSILSMYNRILEDGNIGLISCKLLNGDMSLQYSCRSLIKFGEFLFSRTPMRHLIPSKKASAIEDNYLMKDYNHSSEKKVDWVMGSCMLLSKETFNEVGGFSKEYFMYFEDVDLCYKINSINKEVLYYPEAQMIHLHKQESKKNINKLTFIHIASMLKFYKKVHRDNKNRIMNVKTN